jgi:hypothetical protein
MANKDDFRMKNWVHFAGVAAGAMLQRDNDRERLRLSGIAKEVAEFADLMLEQYMTRYEAETEEDHDEG